MKSAIDGFDRVIISLIQEDGRMPQSELGERASLSTTAVNRRLKILSDSGVIEGYTASINPSAMGYNLTIIVEVMMESERSDLLDQMRKKFESCSQIQQCYYVAGECDFVLIFLVRDMTQYVELTRTLFHENNNVRSFKTLVAMDRVKASMNVPIDKIQKQF
ncbi:Lrp/AsnC family transcriptional regulator [Pseudomonas sp. SWRI100]|uniref:Lrp/AsnC family transcriptional regulator n=1 Tax=Pseudomonas TaxID=286 RepID=UPI0016445078|nr:MULTISPECIES: Lrp/AsnC family transcriptional regulator [Pseudomonas]MBC3495702.1 Lrp/AsnC family transcriptional regulator [Pseudomonas sp. SWRI67]MBV4526810.1 Lrp/AsnC family transcriptional regulator [Pseudomonas kermanshahensis]